MPSLNRSNSLPATDHYGIGFASDSDEEGEGGDHNSMPNLATGTMLSSASASSAARFTVVGSMQGGHGGSQGSGWGSGVGPGEGGMEGCKGLGGGDLHLFFIWVDPSDPCGDRLNEWPLPDKYLTHIDRWQQRYEVVARIYSGQHCLEMVRQPQGCETKSPFSTLFLGENAQCVWGEAHQNR